MIDLNDLMDGLGSLGTLVGMAIAAYLTSQFILKKFPPDHRYTVSDDRGHQVDITLDPEASDAERALIVNRAVAALDATNAGARRPGAART